jgi:hypothetical protein
MLRKLSDGSVIDEEGKLIFISMERFRRDMCEGRHCFLCGVSPDAADFNDEHILPDWLLRSHKLHGRYITLPNGTQFRYDQYTVPCCVSCNSLLGERIEAPVRTLLTRRYEDVVEHIKAHGPGLLCTWLYLVFLKTHLKDTKLRLHRDRRRSGEPISSLLDLSELHHVHCMARIVYTGCDLDRSAFPNIAVLPARTDIGETFDYCDLSHCMSMLLTTGETCLLIALNDCGMSQFAAEPYLKRAAGPLTAVQQRELLARIGFANFKMTERPTFHTRMDYATGKAVIVADVPDTVEVGEHTAEEYGQLFYHLVKDALEGAVNPDIEAVRQGVRAGTRTFIHDDEGNFLERSMYVDGEGTKSPGE